MLSNLADLLRTQPGRLDGAREPAEEALAIDKTLDPDAAEIWKTYGLPADSRSGPTSSPPSDKFLRANEATDARLPIRMLLGRALKSTPGADGFGTAW